MQTEITAPRQGTETIDPADVMIEQAQNRQDRKVITIAPSPASAARLDSDLSDTLSLSARIANSAMARSTGPSGREALIGN